MLTLSDDKSAYATLKGLVAHLEADVKEAKHAQSQYNPRSLDHARAKGAEGAYNLTIGLIYSTDVWRHGALKEAEAMKAKHVHAKHADTFYHCAEVALIGAEQVEAYLDLHNVKSVWEAMTAHGMTFTHCDASDCALLRLHNVGIHHSHVE